MSNEEDDISKPHIIIDNGRGYIKAVVKKDQEQYFQQLLVIQIFECIQNLQ